MGLKINEENIEQTRNLINPGLCLRSLFWRSGKPTACAAIVPVEDTCKYNNTLIGWFRNTICFQLDCPLFNAKKKTTTIRASVIRNLSVYCLLAYFLLSIKQRIPRE